MGQFLGPDDQHYSGSSVNIVGNSLAQYIMNVSHSTVVYRTVCIGGQHYSVLKEILMIYGVRDF